MAASSANLSLLSKPSTASSPPHLLFNLPKTLSANPRPGTSRFKCSAGQTGFFTRLGRLIKEKAKSDVEKVFSGFSKTRENLAVIDELLLYWNLADTDKVLDELEEVLFSLVLECSLYFKFILSFFLYLMNWVLNYALNSGFTSV